MIIIPKSCTRHHFMGNEAEFTLLSNFHSAPPEYINLRGTNFVTAALNVPLLHFHIRVSRREQEKTRDGLKFAWWTASTNILWLLWICVRATRMLMFQHCSAVISFGCCSIFLSDNRMFERLRIWIWLYVYRHSKDSELFVIDEMYCALNRNEYKCVL